MDRSLDPNPNGASLALDQTAPDPSSHFRADRLVGSSSPTSDDDIVSLRSQPMATNHLPANGTSSGLELAYPSTATDSGGGGGGGSHLAQSWLLILFLAPMIVVLLVWLLSLLRRRAEQARLNLLVNLGPNKRQPEQTLRTRRKWSQKQLNGQNPPGQYRPAAEARYPRGKVQRPSYLLCKANPEINPPRTVDAHYPLESSSSGTSTSTASSSSTSGPTSPMVAAKLSVATADASDRVSNMTSVEDDHFNHLHHGQVNRFGFGMQSLVEHMHLYLFTFTCQEILACLVAFTVAILNVVRMRNLFYCNLVIFLLISSKLLNLLTLTTFSLTKLIKLFKLKPLEAPTRRMRSNSSTPRQHQHQKQQLTQDDSFDDQRALNQGEDIEEASGSTTTTTNATTTTTSSSSSSSSSKTSSSSTGDMLKCDDDNKRASGDSSQGSGSGHRCASPFDTSATICRLIEKPDRRGKRSLAAPAAAATGGGAETTTGFCSSSTYLDDFGNNDQSSISSRNFYSSMQNFGTENYNKEPIACRILLLIFLSSLVALACLYLRLVPSNPLTAPLLLNGGAGNRSSQDTWSISIYAPSTTTEASTRYSSGDDRPTTGASSSSNSNNNDNENLNKQQQPNYQATWASRFQQSSQLRHLIEQYELQNFIHLLFDTHLQTSRFTCNLATTNYAPMAKLSMTLIYASLMFIVFALSLAIRQVGKRRLRAFEASSCPVSKLLPPPYYFQSHHLNYHHQHPVPSSATYKATKQYLELPLSPFGQKQTDSNRKRYSELLKQSMRQSSLEMRQNGHPNHQQRHPRQPQRRRPKCGLRNSSSMSSLLAPSQHNSGQLNFSASVERYPAQGAGTALGRYQQQQANGRHPFRRLVGAHSVASLNTVCGPPRLAGSTSPPPANGLKVPAGKLSSSGGHLAWLPLGNAATVASLSNIGCTESISAARDAAAAGNRWLQQSNEPRPTNERRGDLARRDRLGSIGEHLVDCASLDERDEQCSANFKSDINVANYSDSAAKTTNAAGKTWTRPEATSGDSVLDCRIEGADVVVAGREERCDQASQRYHNQRESSSASSYYQASDSWPTTSYHHPQQQQQQSYQLTKNRLSYVELKQDLKLAQAVILFGQLLNHAPILLLLLSASLLPDGLVGGWNSSHDNGFIWLSLIEALTFPLLLCTLDSRLKSALGRSLKCSSDDNITGGGRNSGSRSMWSQHGRQSIGYNGNYYIGGQASGSSSTSTGARLANQMAAAASEKTDHLMLGPSAAYPDFMFVYPTRPAAPRGRRPTSSASPTGADHPRGGFLAGRSHHHASKSLLGCHSLTGPPYPLTGADHHNQQQQHRHRSHEQPLAIDTNDSLRANFALMSKPSLLNCSAFAATGAAHMTMMMMKQQHHELGIIACQSAAANGHDLLLGSRRARHNIQPAAMLVGRGRRKRRVGAILSATRRLFRLNRGSKAAGRRGRRSQAASKFLHSSTNSNSSRSERDRNTATRRSSSAASSDHRRLTCRGGQLRGSGSADRGMSPTSSLSTLIRKFNHDNYTNVCQQYEQRKKLFQGQLDGDEAATSGLSQASEVLIDGLDGPSRGRVDGKTSASSGERPRQLRTMAASLLDEEGIFCRKGGLYYNYCLDEAASADDHSKGSGAPTGGQVERSSRVNPMLNRSGRQLKLKLEQQQQQSIDATKSGEILFGVFDGTNSAAANEKPTAEPESRSRQQLADCYPHRGAKLEQLKLEQQQQGLPSRQQTSSSPTTDIGREAERDTQSSTAALAAGATGGYVAASSTSNLSNKISKSNKKRNSCGGLIVSTTTCSNGEDSGRAANRSSGSNNNDSTIISNITSVQELLDKMNGMMAKQQQVDTVRCGDKLAPDEARPSLADSHERKPKNGGRNNRGILDLVTKATKADGCADGSSNNNNNHNNYKQSDTCANQLRQLAAVMETTSGCDGSNVVGQQCKIGATSSIAAPAVGGVTYDGSGGGLAGADLLADCATEQRSAGGSHHAAATGTLDYATLRSVDDALSLVSVSSEFEYHNIQQSAMPPMLPNPPSSSGQRQHRPGQDTGREPPRTRIVFPNDYPETSNMDASDGYRQTSVEHSGDTKRLKQQDDAQATRSAAASNGPNQTSPSSRQQQQEVADTHSATRRQQLKASSSSSAIDNNRGQLSQSHSPSSSSSSSTETKRLEDLRFPSFLPTNTAAGSSQQNLVAASSEPAESRRQMGSGRLAPAAQQPPKQVVASGGHSRQQPSTAACEPGAGRGQHGSVGDAQRARSSSSSGSPLGPGVGGNKASSSLLNLTAAKFAALNNGQRQQPAAAAARHQALASNHSAGQNQLQAPTSGQRQLGPAGSSSTITKQKGGSPQGTGAGVVTLAEFRTRHQQLPADGAAAECSLPSESGNVRARIRKMEQQQSTSAPKSSQPPQQQQQQPLSAAQAQSQPNANSTSASKSHRPAPSGASMIPTTAGVGGSKLPVPVAAVAGLQQVRQPNGIKLHHPPQRPDQQPQGRRTSASKAKSHSTSATKH